ncbi:hypothetical protein GQ600_7780 [Phytophthora cactorum]|nr:hypothetical protein GQ600_7780 [Phytophthora cactorum]
MSDTTPSAMNVADYIDTDSWDKVVTTITRGGALDEGGDVIHKLRNMNNQISLPKTTSAWAALTAKDVTVEIEATTNFIANLSLVEMQSDNLVSSYMVVSRRLADNKLKAFKFEAMAIEAPGAKDGMEQSSPGFACAIFQGNHRVDGVRLLDPRIKSSAKKIAVRRDIPRKEEKAMYKNGIDFLRDKHRKVFAQTN